MTGRVAGKVAFISGAARGQGRSHAVRLPQEGADIVAADICGPIEILAYPHCTPKDPAETADPVEAQDRRIVTAQADVRDYEALKSVVDGGVEQLGRLDVIVANAGAGTDGRKLHEIRANVWQDLIDINLTGVCHTVKAVVPRILAGARASAIVLTSSVGGHKAYPNTGHYIAAKHVGIGNARIRRRSGTSDDPRQLGTAQPGQHHDGDERPDLPALPPDLPDPGPEAFAPISQMMHTLPVPWLQPVDISNAVLFLAPDESRYVTGVSLTVDAGALLK